MGSEKNLSGNVIAYHNNSPLMYSGKPTLPAKPTPRLDLSFQQAILFVLYQKGFHPEWCLKCIQSCKKNKYLAQNVPLIKKIFLSHLGKPCIEWSIRLWSVVSYHLFHQIEEFVSAGWSQSHSYAKSLNQSSFVAWQEWRKKSLKIINQFIYTRFK